MIIHQGDQYAIPIKIKSDNLIITPDNCTDVRVKINNKMISYSTGELTFNEIEQLWRFPLTEDISFGYSMKVQIQIAVKFDDDYVYSPVQQIDVENSIIKDFWSDGD